MILFLCEYKICQAEQYSAILLHMPSQISNQLISHRSATLNSNNHTKYKQLYSSNNKISMTENYDELYKVILAGDANVGKTHIVYRFIKSGTENFKNMAPTVGVQFSSKMVTLSGDKRIKVQIWDTAGQEQYRAITSAHYRKAQGALVVYDITKDYSFKNVKKWIEGIREHASQNVVIVIVGNKSDLRAIQTVATSQGKNLAKEMGCFFEETSALTGDNIEETFYNMLEEIQKRRKQESEPQSKGFHLKTEPNEGKKQECQC